MDLLSVSYLGLAIAAVVLLPLVHGPARWWLFLAINGAFVVSYLKPAWEHAAPALALALFLLAGYAFAATAQRGRRWAVSSGVVVLTAGFIYLRRYDLLTFILPDSWLAEGLTFAGLSFLFFKMLHVLIDAGSGTLGELRLATYLNYCLNFTTFLLGPIQRYPHFREQWEGREKSIEPTFEAHLDAVNRVLRGLVKKFVFAEFFGRFILHDGLDVAALPPGELLARSYMFYLFLYCDFSGYCDVMIGTGALMGVRPPENFRLPFLARNVSDYWLRVHRSLTLWLTDYVFNPTFAAALRSRWLRQRNFPALAFALLVTMFVSGLWHGTTLSFLCFGLLHGIYLIATRGYEQVMIAWLGRKRFRAFSANLVVHGVAVFLTFNATSLAYVFFVLDLEKATTFFARFVRG